MASESMNEYRENLFILTSGEHPLLPRLECRGAMRALGLEGEITGTAPQIIELGTEHITEEWNSFTDRIGYAFGVFRLLISPDDITRELTLDRSDYADALSTCGDRLREWTSGRNDIGIDCVRVEGAFKGISTEELRGGLGHIVKSSGGTLNLNSPRWTIMAVLSRKIYIGVQLASTDRKGMRERRNQYRPFSLPITLSPNASRALLNLAMVGSGQSVLDPFCGTGGIAIEAAMMGARVYASDLDPSMVDGTRRNLAHVDVDCQGLSTADIEDVPAIFPRMDAVVTDPPYGRSASTSGEEVEKLYRRTFVAIEKVLRPGGRCAMILPSLKALRYIPGEIQIESVVCARVHRSLVRYYLSLIKGNVRDNE